MKTHDISRSESLAIDIPLAVAAAEDGDRVIVFNDDIRELVESCITYMRPDLAIDIEIGDPYPAARWPNMKEKRR